MFQAFFASFSGTAVEFFETVVIAYAIIRAGYPREAISAVIAGHVLVFLAAFFLYPVHTAIPVLWLRLSAAGLLTSMGLYWTLKSLKRLRDHRRPRWAEDPLGKVGVAQAATPAAAFSLFVFFVMMKSSIIEASEILLVVFPIAAATNAWLPVLCGAFSGIAVVVVLSLALHGRLKNIPEVKLKLIVGLILAAIGVSWFLEIYGEYARA